MRATALIVGFPNFAQRIVLHDPVVPVRVSNVLFLVFAHLATWALEQVWIIAPLLIQLAKVFSVEGVGREYVAGPCVWPISVLKELILSLKVLLHCLNPLAMFADPFELFFWPPRLYELPELVRERLPLRPLT